MKLYKLILGIVVLIGIAYGVGWFLRGNEVVYQQVEKEVVLDNLKGKINELKGKLILGIFDAERGGHTEDDGLITFDPNPKNSKIQVASLGDCQFKQATVQYYVQKIEGRTITGKQANDIAFSDEKCKELMTKIVFTYENGHEEWYNTCKKVDCDEQLKIIRLLEQK